MDAGRAAVFLDRDGTIIEERNYLGDPDGVTLLPGAADGIIHLNEAGLPVIVVTNQSGIGRGYFDERDYQAVAARLHELLRAQGARVDASYHCPHGPDESPPCDCRKPGAGLFERAAREHGLDLARSYFVGDRLRDVVPGVRAGGLGFLVGPGQVDDHGKAVPEGVQRVHSLQEAVSRLLATGRFD